MKYSICIQSKIGSRPLIPVRTKNNKGEEIDLEFNGMHDASTWVDNRRALKDKTKYYVIPQL